jgi:aspartate/tyrosine/aromatic aminotransferase
LGIDGLQSFVTAARKLVFGAESPLVKDGKVLFDL